MTWSLRYSPSARRDLRRLDASVRARVIGALERFAELEQGDIRPLSGSDTEWRLRVGDWRVRFEFDRLSRTLHILHVLPRGRAYRD